MRPLQLHDAVLVAGVSLAIASGCAVKPRPPLTPSRVAEGQALVEQGCYLCLTEAHRLFSEAVGRDEAAQRRADEAAILIGLRERELGLADTGHLAAVTARQSQLEPELQSLANVAAAMPWSRRFAVDEDMALRLAALASRTVWREALESPARTSLVAEYVWLSLACSYPDDAASPPTSTRDTVPLIRFRLGTCRGWTADALSSVVGDVPRFVEARYFLGLHAIVNGHLDEAEREIARAYAALPHWPAAANTLAGIAFSLEDFDSALSKYDEALAVDPACRDALLGRVKALSYMSRYTDAMAAADRMLALGEYYVGDAYYWRGWNLYHAGRFEEAEADVTRAKQYMRGAAVAALAGHVAVARLKFADARTDFTAAVTDAPGECDAHYALGGVEEQFRVWPVAAAHFERAVGCYEERERELAETVAKLPPGDLRRRNARAREIEETKRQQGRAAILAAGAWFNSGDRVKARTLAERAASVPEIAAKAGELLARIR